MKFDGTVKILIVGVGAAAAYAMFGPIGVIVIGVLLMVCNK